MPKLEIKPIMPAPITEEIQTEWAPINADPLDSSNLPIGLHCVQTMTKEEFAKMFPERSSALVGG